jgi:hypothetical protein
MIDKYYRVTVLDFGKECVVLANTRSIAIEEALKMLRDIGDLPPRPKDGIDRLLLFGGFRTKRVKNIDGEMYQKNSSNG